MIKFLFKVGYFEGHPALRDVAVKKLLSDTGVTAGGEPGLA